MSDALATVTVTPDQLDLVKRTVASGATDAELKLYLYDCQRQGVHPLDRLLHFTKRGGKYTPVTSIDLMRIRAAETNEYAGSDDAELDHDDNEQITSASVTVWRLVQGQRCSFTATARWKEYCPPPGQDHMWRKMPATMLAKCAEALALRKGFPRQLAGLYAREEMEQASNGNGTSEMINTQTGEVIESPAALPDANGFDAHWKQLEEAATAGFPSLSKQFNGSPEAFRKHVMSTRATEWMALKARATQVK